MNSRPARALGGTRDRMAVGADFGVQNSLDRCHLAMIEQPPAGEVATSRVPGIAQEPDAGLLKQWTAEHVSFRI